MSLDDIFHPRSVAVVGATPGPFNPHTQIFLYSLIDHGYKGKIYPINIKGDEVLGLKVYRNVRDVPGPVDYAICIIPAAATPQLVQDCVAKGVKAIHLYTAGFAETGEDNESKLQSKLVDIARRGGLRILGPNCMGVYCPASGMSYAADFPKQSGNIAFISQSGSYTLLMVRGAAACGLRFSKVVSYGNASDINEIDLLDYLADDPETEIIGAYLEGTRDGPGLAKVLTRAASKKPVIIIKKGSTEAGERGASSHTGALAGDDSVWDSLIKQAGAIRVEDLEEMVDLMVTFVFLPLPRSRKAVLMGVGGGAGVRASDECESGGLILPPVPEDVRAELRRIVPPGSMLRNPIDPGHYAYDWTPVLQTLDNWKETDMLLWHIATDIEALHDESFLQFVIDLRRSIFEVFKGIKKPKAVIVHAVQSDAGLRILAITRKMCQESGVAFYPSLFRAARAIGRFIDYRGRARS